eukprot:2034857-Pyramimonas_sp.AAC.1
MHTYIRGGFAHPRCWTATGGMARASTTWRMPCGRATDATGAGLNNVRLVMIYNLSKPCCFFSFLQRGCEHEALKSTSHHFSYGS